MAEPTDKPEVPEAKHLPDRGRRRLVQGGLGAAPLLMTLASRPALGVNNQCFTPSGFVSMPTSVHGQPQYCSGRTPGFWKQPQKFNEWPSPYLPVASGKKPATLFKTAIFPAPAGPYPTQTMLQVLDMGSGPPDNLGRHLTASILNVKKGWAPVLTLELLKAIWTQYINTGGGITGFFEPTAGVKWYHDQIVEYLITTMPG